MKGEINEVLRSHWQKRKQYSPPNSSEALQEYGPNGGVYGLYPLSRLDEWDAAISTEIPGLYGGAAKVVRRHREDFLDLPWRKLLVYNRAESWAGVRWGGVIPRRGSNHGFSERFAPNFCTIRTAMRQIFAAETQKTENSCAGFVQMHLCAGEILGINDVSPLTGWVDWNGALILIFSVDVSLTPHGVSEPKRIGGRQRECRIISYFTQNDWWLGHNL